MNLCLRPKAVAVAVSRDEDAPPVVPEDSTLRGRAADLHRQLSHLREPLVAPRDQLIINLDFELSLIDEANSPRSGNGNHAGSPSGGSPVHATAAGRASGPATAARAAAAPAPAQAGTSSSNGQPGRSGRTSSSGTSSPWEEGHGPQKRGFVRVKSVRAPQGLQWTHSRKCLEVLITAERTNRVGGYKSHEQRLRERLERLNLDMLIVAGDGNCQFRSISNELYGTQEHHDAIRRQAVAHILEEREAFEAFLGEDFDQYVRQMGRSGTWGDELTLRAVCDSFGMTVHVLTSEMDHWYLTYEPEERKLDREIFLTYIAPIHYNSIRRQSSLKTMALTMSRSFKKIGSSTLSGSRAGSGGLPSPGGPSSPANAAGATGASSGQLDDNEDGDPLRAGARTSGGNGHGQGHGHAKNIYRATT